VVLTPDASLYHFHISLLCVFDKKLLKSALNCAIDELTIIQQARLESSGQLSDMNKDIDFTIYAHLSSPSPHNSSVPLDLLSIYSQFGFTRIPSRNNKSQKITLRAEKKVPRRKLNLIEYVSFRRSY